MFFPSYSVIIQDNLFSACQFPDELFTGSLIPKQNRILTNLPHVMQILFPNSVYPISVIETYIIAELPVSLCFSLFISTVFNCLFTK